MIKTYLISIINSTILLALLIFPLINFRFGMTSPIWPAMDILIIYYLASMKLINYLQIFIISLVLDQLLSVPIGSSGLSFLSASILLNQVARFLIITNYNINCLGFYGYAAIILTARCMIHATLNQEVNITELIFQYLITVSIYPIFRCIIDYSRLKNYPKNLLPN